MSKGNTFEQNFLQLIYNTTAITNLAQNGVSPITSIQIALHTADPGETGNQGTNETTYGGYTRKAVSRNSSNWSCSSSGSMTMQSAQDFQAPSSGTPTITHFSLGGGTSGATRYFHAGVISPNVTLAVGIVPRMTSSTVLTED
jgi:hypothetical protein